MSRETSLVPERSDVPLEDCWDLSRLFASDDEYEKGFEALKVLGSKVESFKETLGESVESLHQGLAYKFELEAHLERLEYYVFLRVAEDGTCAANQDRRARLLQRVSEIQARFSYFEPELQKVPKSLLQSCKEEESFADYHVYLDKILRYKPHVLTQAEERILAMQQEFSGTAGEGFRALNDMDLSFGALETDQGMRDLTHSSYAYFMQHPDRSLREKAYNRYYEGFEQHKHTFAALYNGSVQRDIFTARVRNFGSAREAALFGARIPAEVYDQLIDTTHQHLEPLHAYYALRKKVLGLSKLSHYDVRVPLLSEFRMNHTYEEATHLVLQSLEVLGSEYTETLQKGLRGGWVDRYENKGKASGAFSAGSYQGDPYILLNYKEDVLDDVFTLAHEAGHSMHSWYSVRQNPFPHYHYTIFVAEVASTFNEQLLARTMMRQATDPRVRLYLINKQVDDIVGTLYRQTMFAEFERDTHMMVESGTPLTVDSLRKAYRGLLEKYFGPEVSLSPQSDLECFRIPHFYSAFYVYQYATGIAAAVALSEKVLNGAPDDLDAYLNFLKSGGSKYPLEQLQAAGVDMSRPDAVSLTLQKFGNLVDQLEEALAEIE